MCRVIQIDPEVMGGTPVFEGTRVPISTLFDYLSEPDADSNPVSVFLEDFPTVQLDQITELLEYYKTKASTARRAA